MDDRLLKLLVDLRFALGDNGQRMQDELVEYAKLIKAKADEADALREELAIAKSIRVPLASVGFGVRDGNMYFSIGNQSFRLAYEPTEPAEFDFMRHMLLAALSRLVPGASVTQEQPQDAEQCPR